MMRRKLRKWLIGLSKWWRGMMFTGIIGVWLLFVYFHKTVETKTSSSNGGDQLNSIEKNWKARMERTFDSESRMKRTKRTAHKNSKKNPEIRRTESEKSTETFGLARSKRHRYLKRKRAFCGTADWREEYKKLHREILLNMRPPRFLVYYCGGRGHGCGGYGNRLGAIASLFFLAVLTNRAFLIEWNYTPISIQDYFQPKGIQWNFTLKKKTHLTERTHYWGAGVRSKLAENITRPFPDESSKFKKWLETTDLFKYFNYSVEKLTSMWYFGGSIWKNKYLADRMNQLVAKEGRGKFSTVGCAFDFLFQLTPRLEGLLMEARTQTGINQVPLIGIHIRMGDASFGRPSSKKGAVITKNYKAFFACAKKYERDIAQRHPELAQNKIKWFVTSDDRSIKRYALREFKEKVVVLNNKVEHIAMFRGRQNSPSDEGMVGVLLDHFILSECDFLVVSKSSFSYTALGLTFHKEGEYAKGEDCVAV